MANEVYDAEASPSGVDKAGDAKGGDANRRGEANCSARRELSGEDLEECILLEAILERLRSDLWRLVASSGDPNLGLLALVPVVEPARRMGVILNRANDRRYKEGTRQLKHLAEHWSEMHLGEGALALGMARECIEDLLRRHGALPDRDGARSGPAADRHAPHAALSPGDGHPIDVATGSWRLQADAPVDPGGSGW